MNHAATLLLVVRQRTPFSEVNVGSGANAWVLTDRLATGPTEVGIAKLATNRREDRPVEQHAVAHPRDRLLDPVVGALALSAACNGACKAELSVVTQLV